MKKPSHAQERGLGETTKTKTDALHISERRLPVQAPSNRRERIAQANVAAIALLAAMLPHAFVVHQARRRPLKVGIYDDLIAALDGVMTAVELGRALRIYTSNAAYRSRLIAGATRIDLNGEPAGVVTPEQQAGSRVAARSTPPPSASPQRLSLRDLKAAAARRRQAGAS